MIPRDALLWLVQQAGVPRRKLALLPDFLVVSPPKTGSTWLADNLRLHPGLFVPAIKEVRYFSAFGDWAGLEWYLDHFADAGTRLKGEASPSYALLSTQRIRLVRDLMPDLKVVFLLREPVARAWSHARHTFRYCEAGFAHRTHSLEEMTERDWLDGFRHPWLVANNDYLGQLDRWLGVFPREQVFLGFFEDLVRRPEGLFRDVLTFLGVDASLSLDGFPLHERILPGMEVPLTPRLERELRASLQGRAPGLIALLREQGVQTPPEWDWCRDLTSTGVAPVPVDAAALEAEFPSSRCLLGEHHGYELVCNRGRFLAMLPDLAPGRPEDMPAVDWQRHKNERNCFEGESLADVKRQIDQHFLDRQEAARDQLQATRRELEQERSRVAVLAQRLHALEEKVERHTPPHIHMARWLRRAVRFALCPCPSSTEDAAQAPAPLETFSHPANRPRQGVRILTHQGPRARTLFPESLLGYRLRRESGRIYAVPPHLDFDEILHAGRMESHPDILRGATLDEVAGLIAQDEPAAPVPQGECDGYSLWTRDGRWYAVPPGVLVDLAVAEDRDRACVLSASSEAELEERVRDALGDAPIEFAGWLPIYTVSGNCGKHPQFAHINNPPHGFRFTRSAPPQPDIPAPPSLLSRMLSWPGKMGSAAWAALRPLVSFLRPTPGLGLRGRWRVMRAAMRLWNACRRNGASIGTTLRFLQSRHLRSQLLLANHPGPVFLTSMPYTYGQWPWLVEIEDVTTLFYPLVQNGRTQDVDLRSSPYFPCVKALLEDEACRGIVTHIHSTAQLVEELFQSDIISKKISYAPMGVKLPARFQKHEEADDSAPIDLLFINSWHQMPGNFYLRGGLDVLEAFAVLKARYPRLRLTLRTSLPPLDARYRRILESGWVRVIDRFLSTEEMAALHASSHIFLLPAARIHIVSLLQAMAAGLPVVASDGWGIEEYLEDDRNGLVVKGRYGQVSWADHEAGVLREDYEPMCLPDAGMVRGIVDAVSRLMDEPGLRARLGRAARADVETRYNLEQWNASLGAALRGTESVSGGRESPVEPDEQTNCDLTSPARLC